MARDLRLTEANGQNLDELSVISPSDAERARERWKEVAPLAFRALADVTEETGVKDEP